jgi:hypothetical protein
MNELMRNPEVVAVHMASKWEYSHLLKSKGKRENIW